MRASPKENTKGRPTVQQLSVPLASRVVFCHFLSDSVAAACDNEPKAHGSGSSWKWEMPTRETPSNRAKGAEEALFENIVVRKVFLESPLCPFAPKH